MLTPELKANVASRLRLASGLMATVEIGSLSSEYDIRNSLSRLYYAFYHASLAVITKPGLDAKKLSHGMVHSRIQGALGEYMGRRVRALYDLRRHSDYEINMFSDRYQDNIEEARKELIEILKRANTDFRWLYREANKLLR